MANIRINSKSDFFTNGKLLKPIIEELCRNYDLNGMGKISRKELQDAVSEHIKASNKVMAEKYINKKTGIVGRTYLSEAIDLYISHLRTAGCIQDERLNYGEYFLTKDMYRYLTHDVENHIKDIITNFKKDIRENLVWKYTKNNPEYRKIVLIKANTGVETSVNVKTDTLKKFGYV